MPIKLIFFLLNFKELRDYLKQFLINKKYFKIVSYPEVWPIPIKLEEH